MFQGKLSTDGEKDDIAFTGGLDIKEFHLDVAVFIRVYRAARRPGTAENAELIDVEGAAFFQALPNLLAHGARRTHNANRVAHG